MIQKYLIQRDNDSGNLTIEEKAVVDPIPRGTDVGRLTDDVFRLQYCMTHSQKKIESAIKKGKSGVIVAIRDRNFFPSEKHCDAIADAIIQIFDSGETFAELFFNACDLYEETEKD